MLVSAKDVLSDVLVEGETTARVDCRRGRGRGDSWWIIANNYSMCACVRACVRACVHVCMCVCVCVCVCLCE